MPSAPLALCAAILKAMIAKAKIAQPALETA
jgi:hypothetical protein